MVATELDLGKAIQSPVGFAKAILRHDVWDTQAKILESVAHNPRTAVKACHASSKTFTAAEAVLWWITRFRDGVVITTAPTWTQVERVMWGEIHKAILTADVKYPVPLNQTELRLGPDRYAIGLSTNMGVRFQGFHGRILIIIDEAPGVAPEIWEAIEGIRAGGNVSVLALGNPVQVGGPFYEAFTDNREGWQTYTISAFDTPNLRGLSLKELLALPEDKLDITKRPYLVSRRWVRDKYYEWGVTHPLWESRVMGQFPTQSEDALISLAWLEAAANREPVPGGEFYAGVDVAGPGEDETVLTIRAGGTIMRMKAWVESDPRGPCVAELLPFRDRLKKINVDSVGIGYNFARHLEDIFGNIVEDVNVGESPHDSEQFKNLKAELYWGLRQRFIDNDVHALPEAAIDQLAGLRYKHNSRGQVEIESKEAALKRGVKSPDKAESIMLAFAEVKRGSYSWL